MRKPYMTTKRTSGLKLDAELKKDEKYVENTWNA